MTLADNWGATAAERALRLPCDELLPGAALRAHRAVTIDAPPATVYRWLCQLRFAPYSYDLIDNLGRRSPRHLIPDAEILEPGQPMVAIFRLHSATPGEQLTLQTRRAAMTYAVRAGEGGTRLLGRLVFDPPGGRLGAALIAPALSLGDLVMMRRQLLNFKALAERTAAGN